MRVVLDEADILDVSVAEFVALHAPYVSETSESFLLRQVALDLLRVRGWKRVRTIYLDEIKRCVIFAHEPRVNKTPQSAPASFLNSHKSSAGDRQAHQDAPQTVIAGDTRVVVTSEDDAKLDVGEIQRIMAALHHAASEPPVDDADRIVLNEYTLAIVSRDSVTSFYDLVLGLDALTERHKHQFD